MNHPIFTGLMSDTTFAIFLAVYAVYSIVRGVYSLLGHGIESTQKNMWFGKNCETLNMEKVNRIYGIMNTALGVFLLGNAYLFYVNQTLIGTILCFVGIGVHALAGLYVSRDEKFKQ